MRKFRAVLALLIVISSYSAYAKMYCVAGAAFRDRYGNLIECLEEAGDDCARCYDYMEVD